MQRHKKPKPPLLLNLQPKPVPLQSTIDLSLIRSLQSSPSTPKDSNFQSTTSTSWYKQSSPNKPQHSSSKSQVTKTWLFEAQSHKTKKTQKPKTTVRDQISASMHQSWLLYEHWKAQIPIQTQPRRHQLKHLMINY